LNPGAQSLQPLPVSQLQNPPGSGKQVKFYALSIFGNNTLSVEISGTVIMESHEKATPCKNHMFTNFQKYPAAKFCGKQIIVEACSPLLALIRDKICE